MRGYLHLIRKHGKGAVTLVNDAMRQEIDRFFRLMVDGVTPNTRSLRVDPLFKGGHTLDTTAGLMKEWVPWTHSAGLSQTGQVNRYRLKASMFFDDFPDSTTRLAFAAGRAYIFTAAGVAPNGILSTRDFAQSEIGNTYGHPTGRRAYFPETAIAPVGFGAVDIDGVLALAPDEEGHYIYDIRITEDGDDGSGTAAQYFYRRRPYWAGAYEQGSSETDFLVSAGSDLLSTRIGPDTNRSNLNISNGTLGFIPNGSTAPTDAEVNYQLDYPTAAGRAASADSFPSGMGVDGQTPSRIWYCVVEDVNAASANASRSRSVWLWNRWSPEPPRRVDAADGINAALVGSWPALGASVQYRDLKVARNGYIFIAADGDDDESNGSNVGALIQVDSINGAETIVNVHGETAAGIYTQGGLFQNNVLAITIDTTESAAAAGFDRVWVLHRNGLSYGDMDITDGSIASWTTVANAGADTNIIAAGSVRGIACFNTTNWADYNGYQPMLAHDTSGRVYWISTSGAEWDTGKQRLNRLDAAVTTHTYYTIDSVAEGGAVGYIDLGQPTGTGSTGSVSVLHVHRRDVGDPVADDIWLATVRGAGGATNDRIVHKLPVDEWGGAVNPGAGYFGATVTTSTSVATYGMHVTQDGQVFIFNSVNNNFAILEGFGRETTISGLVDQFDVQVGGIQTIHRDTGSGSAWTAEMVGKRVRISGSSDVNNDGSFVVDAFTDSNTIDIHNAAGVATGTGEAAAINNAGAEFDSRGTVGGLIGSWANGAAARWEKAAYNPYFENSGYGYVFQAREGAAPGDHTILMHFPVHYQWSGSEWYRSSVPHIEAAAGRNASTSPVALDSGVTVTFTNQNAGVNEFFKNEYYTAMATIGLGKDPTQELRVNYDLFTERTDLIDEHDTDKTASDTTAIVGYQTGSLASVATDNPLTGTSAALQKQLAAHQRSLELNGSNNTSNADITQTLDATNGVQISIDTGADAVADRLVFCMGNENAAGVFANLAFDLYSATAASGPASWTLRASYTAADDHPEWFFTSDAFQTDNGAAGTLISGQVAVTIDLAALAANSNLASPVTNDAMRHWKLVMRSTSSTAATFKLVGFTAFGTTGDPLGISDDHYLLTANDSNYMANYVIRAVWLQDDEAAAGGNTSGTGTTITLLAGTFDIDILEDDFFREINGSGDIVQEHRVLSRDSGTQLTLKTPVTTFTNQNWEVVRNADVRPTDATDGTDLTARLPAAANEVFICPVTGYIFYHADDVTAGRTLRVDTYAKVKRSL